MRFKHSLLLMGFLLLTGCSKPQDIVITEEIVAWEEPQITKEERIKLEDMSMEQILALKPLEFKDICALDYPTIAENLGMTWDNMQESDWENAKYLYVRVKFGTYGPTEDIESTEVVEKPEITHNYAPDTIEYFMYTDTDLYRAMSIDELREVAKNLRNAVFPDLTDEDLIELTGMTWEQYIESLPEEDIRKFMLSVAEEIDNTNEEYNIEFENGENE